MDSIIHLYLHKVIMYTMIQYNIVTAKDQHPSMEDIMSHSYNRLSCSYDEKFTDSTPVMKLVTRYTVKYKYMQYM